jgi:hypothetical protein
VFGVDATRHPVEAHRRLASVPGDANLWPRLPGSETLHLLGRVHGRVDGADRDELIERFDLDPSKRVRAYSRGNRQKVLLVAALMTRADLLVLDEPTAGLDPLMEQVFRACVREAAERGQAVFLSSHLLSERPRTCPPCPGSAVWWSTVTTSNSSCAARSGRCCGSWRPPTSPACRAGSPRSRSCSSATTARAATAVPVTERRLTAPPATSGRPSSAVLAITARAACRSAAVWGYVFGALVASSAWSYADLYRTDAERHRLAAAFGANKASAALFGPAPALQTVAASRCSRCR